jgi:hypothetical protein
VVFNGPPARVIDGADRSLRGETSEPGHHLLSSDVRRVGRFWALDQFGGDLSQFAVLALRSADQELERVVGVTTRRT